MQRMSTRRRIAAAAAALPLFAALLPVSRVQAQHGHRFTDAQRWSRVFDDPSRDAWQKPAEVISALALSSDAIVADVGAGTGYFAVRLARALPSGRVYAVDLEPDMVQFLAQRAREEQLQNLVAVAGAADSPNLPEAVDLLLMVNVYHHVGKRPAYFQRLKPKLRAGGRVAIVDYKVDASGGPPRSSRLAPETVIAEMKQAGMRLLGSHDLLPNQYFLEFGVAD